MSWVCAIDFGTSNTAAAYVDANRTAIQTLALSHHGNLLSSAVFVNGADQILVGDHALDQAATNPAAFVPAPKRLVGQGVVRVGGIDVSDTAIVGAVLRTVIDHGVRGHNGQPPEQLVLTHPVAWPPEKVRTLVDSAVGLGFPQDRVRTVSEPVAAVEYYTRTAALPAGQRIAVFDFGGGTLDVAVLAATDQHTFTVLGAGGDDRIGGRNLDAVLGRWVDTQLDEYEPDLARYFKAARQTRGRPDQDPAAARALNNLDDSIRRAKELLSETPSATIHAAGGGMQHTVQITRDEFDSIIGDQIDRGILLTRNVFHNAGLTGPQDLQNIYLTGGSSRIPLVHERLKQLGNVATLDDPKTVVVRGALDAVGATQAPPAPAPQAAAPTAPSPLRGATSTDTGRSTTRNPRVLAAAAAVAVVVAAGGVYALTRGGDTPTTETANGDTTAETTTPAADQPKAANTVNSVLKAIPPALERDSSCRKQDFTPEGAIEISCDIRGNATTATGLTDKQTLYYTAIVDAASAKNTLSSWDGDTSGEMIGAKTARAKINDLSAGNAYLTYANSDSGLNLSIRGFLDRNAAITFLQRATLI